MANISVAEFVAAVFQDNWYVGKICTIDHEDSEIEISFLQMRKWHISGHLNQTKFGFVFLMYCAKYMHQLRQEKQEECLSYRKAIVKKKMQQHLMIKVLSQIQCDRYVTDFSSICLLTFCCVQVHVTISVEHVK